MKYSRAAPLFLVLLTGCAVLRSRPQLETQWSLYVFPEAPASEREAASMRLARFNGLASDCVVPDSLTFAATAPCQGVPSVGGGAIVVGSWAGGRHRIDLTRVLMQSPAARGGFASRSAALARERGHRGMLIDFPLLGPRDVDGLSELVSAIRDSARAAGLGPIGMVVPAADTSAYPSRLFGALTDFIAVRLEQPLGTAGPISPRGPMTRFVGVRAGEIGASRLVVAIPAYGRIRREGADPERISYAEARRAAADWGVTLERDETSFGLVARHPRLGEIWVNDAVAIGVLVRDARRLGVTRFALYGLGGEDPAVWSDVIAPRALQTSISSR